MNIGMLFPYLFQPNSEPQCKTWTVSRTSTRTVSN
jgi:hypothetical protein